jgi:hypothetical protein
MNPFSFGATGNFTLLPRNFPGIFDHVTKTKHQQQLAVV